MGILEPQKPGVIAPPWKPPCNSGKSNDSLDNQRLPCERTNVFNDFIHKLENFSQ